MIFNRLGSVRSLPRLCLGVAPAGTFFWVTWYAAGLIVVVLAPSYLRGEAFWGRPPAEIPQHLVMGAAFLALALFLRTAAVRPNGVGVVAALMASASCFGAGYLFLLSRPDMPHSRAVLLLSGVLGVSLALLPFARSRHRWSGMAGLAAVTAVLAAILPDGTTPESRRRDIRTALQSITVTLLPGVIGPVMGDGGAITVYDDGFFLVTAHGEFYRLDWDSSGSSLQAARLALSAPIDREAFLADHQNYSVPPRLRVTDIAVDTSAVPRQIVLAHQHWNPEGRCFTMRVSTTPLVEPFPATPSGWETAFESQPCLSKTSSYDDLESGGRLAWDRDGRLLLTLGDHGFDGRTAPALAQRTDGDYGKVIRLDMEGGRELVSMGHRNPQGLAVDREGRIWLTEHGPQGGDELNLVVEGRNYGWPLATYGTDYGTHSWPLAPAALNHGRFEEPALAFVPSIAISNVIQVGGERFPAWDGDLLVSSLRRQGLFRVRTRDERVVYVEPIPVNRRIRDLEQGSDGRILLWIDGGEIALLAGAEPLTEGERVYAQCAWCHDPPGDGVAAAPSLRGVVGRPVASVDGYAYSRALTRLGGRWTAARLDEFITDPEAYAPGTHMKFRGITDPAQRRLLISYLERFD